MLYALCSLHYAFDAGGAFPSAIILSFFFALPFVPEASFMAALASTIPPEMLNSFGDTKSNVPGCVTEEGNGLVLSMIIFLTCFAERSGYLDRIKAAIPETTGAAILVPLA